MQFDFIDPLQLFVFVHSLVSYRDFDLRGLKPYGHQPETTGSSQCAGAGRFLLPSPHYCDWFSHKSSVTFLPLLLPSPHCL